MFRLVLSVSRMMLIFALAGGVTPLCFSVSHGTSQEQATPPSADLKQADGAGLRIGSGDLVDISVYGAADFRQEIRVAPNGDVSLPFVGLVHLGGLETADAQILIHRKLVEGGFYKDPQVTVFIKEYSSAGVFVLGEVQKPGFYPLTNISRVLEAISVAGGTTPKAGQIVTVLNRNQPTRILTLHLSTAPNSPSNDNVELLPGDTVTVSKAGVVYVVGDVRLPTGVVMEHGHITVLQAIAMAQGTSPTAALNRAKLIRKDPSGPHEISLELKKIMSAKAPDIPLEDDDIVFVPSSAGKNMGKKSLDTALQAVVGIAIWGRY